MACVCVCVLHGDATERGGPTQQRMQFQAASATSHDITGTPRRTLLSYRLVTSVLHAVLRCAVLQQERIKALIEERKKLLEGGSGADGGSSSHANSGAHQHSARSTLLATCGSQHTAGSWQAGRVQCCRTFCLR